MRADIRPMLYLVILTGLLATTDGYAGIDGSMDGWPEWVVEAMGKEKRKMKLRAAKMPIDSISTKLPGKQSAPQAIEDGWYFVSDIKAGSPLECYIYTTALDLATFTHLLAERNIEAVETANGGTTDTRYTHFLDAGEVNGFPSLALEWMYVISTESEPVVGFTKVRAAVKGDMGFACTHNYLGYRETFAKAFTDFVENTEYESTTPEPYYEEITRLDYNGIGAGVAYYSFTEDEDGDTVINAAEASLMGVDQNTVSTIDAVSVSYARPDGMLINSLDVNVENGEITSNMSLYRNDEGTWISSGTLQDKELESEIDGSLTPAASPALIAAARDLFRGEETSVTLDIWVPSVAPSELLAATLQRDDSETERQATVSVGPLSYTGQFDPDGNLLNSNMSVGPLTITTDLIWSAGKSLR